MDIYWIWLSTIPYVGPVLQKRLIQQFNTPYEVFIAEEGALRSLRFMNRRSLDSLLKNRSLKKAEHILNSLKNTSTKLLTYNDPLYPQHAKPISQSPIALYYRGKTFESNESVSVVGSRRCSTYGKQVAKELASQLAFHGVPVVSGLAKGIDSYAHTACLKTDGYTIAFVAHGVDICYPREHLSLYEKCLEKGMVISPYPPGTKPHPKQFVQRNALITAWTTHVVIVEAGEKSGALTTADFAKQHKRKLYAVPNRIDVKEGIGTNRLIQEGAIPYLNFDSLQIGRKRKTTAKKKLNGVEEDKKVKSILSLLEDKPTTVADLAKQLKMDEKKLIEQLFSLELERKVFLRGEWVSMHH